MTCTIDKLLKPLLCVVYMRGSKEGVREFLQTPRPRKIQISLNYNN